MVKVIKCLLTGSVRGKHLIYGEVISGKVFDV